jgi:quercetin dioxygenase-like cupin family protein
MQYQYFPNLITMVDEIPPDSIVSRTFYQDDHLRAILFGFAPGQELSEHTASVAATIHLLEGEARLTIGGDEMQGQAGTWVHMEANLPHSLFALTPVKMLLLMEKKSG